MDDLKNYRLKFTTVKTLCFANFKLLTELQPEYTITAF